MKLLVSLFLLFPAVQGIMRGISTFGFETEYNNLMCAWEHNHKWHLQKIQELGFNYIRLPFSHDYLQTDMKTMDNFFNEILETNIMVVLDYHRIYNTNQSPKPYDQYHTLDNFIHDWLFILDRYKYNSHLMGVDLFNEWQDNNFDEWNNVASITIKRIEEAHPFRFFYFVGCYNWGGNCRNVKVDVAYQDRIYYTIHKYVWSDSGNLEQKWDDTFGASVGNGSKIVVGETGFISSMPNQKEWFKNFLHYLKDRNIYNSFFWSWSFNSGDTGGILKEDCSTIDMVKMGLLWDYWSFKEGYNNPRLRGLRNNCIHYDHTESGMPDNTTICYETS